MFNKKKLVSMLVLLAFIIAGIAVTGCGQKKEAATDKNQQGDKKQPTVAVMVKNTDNPFWKAVRQGAEKVAAERGLKLLQVSPAKPDNIEEQIRLVEDLIVKYKAKQIDGMIFVPVDYKALAPVVKKANEAGLPILDYCNRLAAGGDYFAYVGQDDYKFAKDEAAKVAEMLHGKGKVVIIEGVPGALTAQDRLRGFQDALKNYPDIEILASQTGQYLRVPAMEVMDNLLQRFPKIDAVISANDTMALGAIQALESAGRLKGTIVSGCDAIPDAIQAIEDGRLTLTVDYSGFRQGMMATSIMADYLEGKQVQKENPLEYWIITKDNLGDVLKKFDEIGQPH